jgi:branched-chain amino acid aminotransferase
VSQIFINDRLVDEAQACISINDGALLYGVGLFEVMRAANGAVFAMEDHVSRLITSATALGIPCTYEPGQIEDAVKAVLKANSMADARIRLTLTSGPMVSEGGKSQSTLIITAGPFEFYPPEYYKTGVTVILSQFRINPLDPCAGHQTINYLPRLLALNIARQKMTVEAIWFTTENSLAEGSLTNIFLVSDGKLFTPPLTTPVVSGIVRARICKLAVKDGIEVIERELFIDDVLGASEIFLTSIVAQVLPVTKVEAHVVGDGKVGQVTTKMMKAFQTEFENETRGIA